MPTSCYDYLRSTGVDANDNTKLRAVWLSLSWYAGAILRALRMALPLTGSTFTVTSEPDETTATSNLGWQ